VTEVQHHPVQPGVETRLATAPVRRLSPDAQKAFLRHILGLIGIAQYPAGEGEQTGQLARHHLVDGGRLLVANTGQQLNVRINFFQSGKSRSGDGFG